jgi:hypothetical protein
VSLVTGTSAERHAFAPFAAQIRSFGCSDGVAGTRSIHRKPDTLVEGVTMAGPSQVLEWLRLGVPLSLLLDLAAPEGPDSREIARYERAAS